MRLHYSSKNCNNKLIKSNQFSNINDALKNYIDNSLSLYDPKIIIKSNPNNYNVDYSNMKQSDIFRKAKMLFSKIGSNVFKNNGEFIYVDNSDLKECVSKILTNSKQKKIIAQHMDVISNLDHIIENAEIIAIGDETKGRGKYKNWKYYVTPININNDNYIVEFDTVLKNGERHFRLQRIYNNKEKQKSATSKVE